MERATFEVLERLVREHSGIDLVGKEALVSNRLAERKRRLGIDDDGAYLRRVLDDPDGAEIEHLLDALTTNVTRFLRDAAPFEFLGRALERRYRDGQRRFRLWSAACATGEEAYSIAMTVRDVLPPSADVRILATDLSRRALEVCIAGRYPEAALEGVPARWRERYFDGGCCVRPEVAASIVFRRFNLAELPLPMTGPVDAIFCRNVLFYLDGAVRARLLAELVRILPVGGHLVIGSSENLLGTGLPLVPVGRAIYERGAA